MDIFGVLTLIGGLALFLYGMNVMGAGLEKMSGGKLEQLLEKLTSNPLKAVLLGAGVTAVIQSSSATTVMVVGFVNSGIMKLSQAIGIIMGANIGTTITAWLLSLTGIEGSSFFMQMLKPSSFAPDPCACRHYFYHERQERQREGSGQHFTWVYGVDDGNGHDERGGKAACGCARSSPISLTMFDNPVFGVIAGAVLTGIIQSSSASVGILQALSVTGVFTFQLGDPNHHGTDLGTCVTAMISAVGANKGARRTAFVHLYFDLIGTLLFLTVYFIGNAIIGFSFADQVVGEVEIAPEIHTIFNVFTTLVLLPFTKVLEKLAYLTIPLGEDEQHVKGDTFAVLDERFLNSPAFAIEQCRTLISQMAEMTRDSFLEAMEVLGVCAGQGG